MNEELKKKALNLIDESKRVVETNIYKLEKELKYQSVYYQNYSGILADLHHLKNNLRSDLDDQERSKYLRDKGKPPSEAYMENLIKNNKEIITLQLLMEKLESVLKSLDHKKSSLENLVKLELAGYYSEPKINREE